MANLKTAPYIGTPWGCHMWDGLLDRRQTFTPFTGLDRRNRVVAAGPDSLGPAAWASMKDHRVPVRIPQPAPRMAHWDGLQELDLWE